MNKLQLVQLDQIADVRRGTVITGRTAGEGTVPVIAGGLSPAYFTNLPNRPAGTITISGSGANAGFVNRWSTEIWASDCTTVITLDPENWIQEYIYYFLKSQQGYIMQELRQGAAQPHVYPKDIKMLQIPDLDKLSQQKLVKKLSLVFKELDAIELNIEKEAQSVAQLRQSVLLDAFRV